MVPLSDAVWLEKQNDISFLWIDNPPVNTLNAAVRKAVFHGISTAMQDDDVRALILMAKGKLFCAGADIREFGTPLQLDPPILRDILDLLDQASKPVVVAMHGMAVGGAVELALSCHYRLASADARFSLPEVKLGIIPGSGGTQRLPRLIGPEKALSMIVSGDPVDADKALQDGLIDDCITDDLAAGAACFARRIADIRPLPRTRDMTAKIEAARQMPALFSDWRRRLEADPKGEDAPKACVDAIEAAVTMPFDAGMVMERTLCMKLINSPRSVALRHGFFAGRQTSGNRPGHR
ncbi:enoyl-CoA hydratase/isomerase family protein [Desulfosarcina sp. OttesenSCG-928-A07]|nr:enoyl-CoA hydratase/isomerase family protein [Desulfosarcina sp. OttesenSCG-928-A07]